METGANPISSSCQSIATVAAPTEGSVTSSSFVSLAPTCSLGGTSGASHYVIGTGSLGRLQYHNKHKNSLDASEDYSQLSQSTHILGRYKSERFLASKPDEDRRRRTIIIERKNHSYGFTLQSYGIHYKRDEDVEMITYVDYVEYDGPAYRAGMREGDVILSINGTDMEKADHKTIVDFIKNCDARMRMVVLFEDCVKKVDLHMRYIQLQNILQSKMNELERVCLRERELLEGKWKTHSLPARKKNITSPSDAESGTSPADLDVPTATYVRPTLSTEDVANITRHQTNTQPTIIPPPAQFMLTYHYLDPTYRYVIRPTTTHTSSDYTVRDNLQRSPSDQHFVLQRAESMETTTVSQATKYHSQLRSADNSSGKPPAPPPRTCEKHKPPNKHQQQQQQQQQQSQQQMKSQSTPQKLQKSSGKHYHGGHSCNPCLGHFRWKSVEKPPAANVDDTVNGNSDNISLDAYDLASPCCDSHCVPGRRRSRHHEKHTHKHKHRDRDRDGLKDQRHTRPKSQTYVSPGAASSGHHVHHHHHNYNHQHQQHHNSQKHACDSHSSNIRSRYFDLASGLASHCSLHSCTSSELAPADSTSYTTSISTDTLFWDPKSEAAQSRQHSTKSRQSYDQQQIQVHAQAHAQAQAQAQAQSQADPHHHINRSSVYQQHYHITATQIQPSQIYPNANACVHKPKSWDNLATKVANGYGFAYGYLDTVAAKPPIKLQIAQQRHSMPRRNPYGRYSTDVENYAPPPTEFVGELTTTTTTTITAKSTEELIASAPCDCLTKQQQQQALKAAQYQLSQQQKYTHRNTCQMGYYSHLPRPTTDVGTSTTTVTTEQMQQPNSGENVATVTEVTRL